MQVDKKLAQKFTITITLLWVVIGCNNIETRELSPNPGQTTSITGTPTPIDLVLNSQQAKRGGTLVLANRDDPPAGFDTMRTSSIALHHIAGSLFGPGNLVTRCRENMYIICPSLARSWVTNEDFTEWTFTIRDNVQWHDGEKFTAWDAKFWYELAVTGSTTESKTRAPAYFRTDLGGIKSIDVLSGNQLRLSLNHPQPKLLEALMNPRYKIAHPAHIMGPLIDQGEMSVAPLDIGLIGTGPFQIEEYKRGSMVRLKRFDHYWEKDAAGNSLPYLDMIDFIIIPNPSTMDAAFRSGRLDGGARGEGHYLTVERKKGYDNEEGLSTFYATMQGGLFRLAFNMLREGPWQNAEVREAIALWIDKQAAIPSALGGFGYVSPILGPTNPFTSPNFINWPRFNHDTLKENRDQALDLIENAGYADGFSMGYLCRARLIPRCEFLAAQLSGLNIDLQLHIADEAEWNRGRMSLDYDSQSGSHFTSPVPEGTESVFGEYQNNRDSYAKHQDAQVSRLYQTLKLARTHSQRVAAWRQIEKYIVLEQTYVIPIAGTLQVVPYQSYVSGLVIPPEDGHTHTDFASVWLNHQEIH